MDHPTLPEPRKACSNWQFWFKWVAASLAGILLSFGMVYGLIFLVKAISPSVDEDRFAGWITFPLLATVLGAAQWLVLRERIPRSGWWILATAAGLPAGIALVQGAGLELGHIINRPWVWDSQLKLLILYIMMGLWLGLAQIPILWRHIRSPALWLLASMIGWFILGLIVGKSLDRLSDLIAFGAVPAVFTGLGLIWHMRTLQRPTNIAEAKE